MAQITSAELPSLARGCAVLGTGGGGSVDTGLLAAGRAVSEYGAVPLVAVTDLPPEAIVVPLSGIGAPTVSHEMIAGTDEILRLRDEVERLMQRPIGAVMSSEIGGSNGVYPVAWAARLGVPLLDADGMGRAFPEVQMVSMYVAGLPVNVVVLADIVGNVTTVRPVDGVWSERIARAVCVAGGAHAVMADYVLTAEQAVGAVIEGSVSHALAVGRATEGSAAPLDALIEQLGARHVIDGKIIDVERRTQGGFVRGSVVIEEHGGDRLVRVELQNENLVVFDAGRLIASVPDLIGILDTQTGAAISTEMLRYGQRVSVLAWPCDPIWRTDRGLAVVGPRAFGYDVDYVPVEQLGDGRD